MISLIKDTFYKNQNRKTNDEDTLGDKYDIICKVLEQSQKIILTTYSLPEITNKIINRSSYSGIDTFTKDFLQSIFSFEEKYKKHNDILNCSHFNKFGFTDISIVDAAKELNCAVITDDSELLGLASNMGLQTLCPKCL